MTCISWSSDFVLYLETTWWINVVLEILIQCDTNIELKLYVSVSDIYFMVQWFLPYILKTIWWTNVLIGILDPCDAKIYYIKCMWVSDLQFMVQWFCLISWRLFDSMWHKHWTETIYVGQWPIFHGQVSLPYILKTICWTNAIVGILDPCDAKINHIKCMWVSDLHFMVQWFWLISWRRFDGGMLDWRYWFIVTLSIYVGQWPIFCGTVSLPYIFNTIWWTSLILWILPLTCTSWLSVFESFTYFCL